MTNDSKSAEIRQKMHFLRTSMAAQRDSMDAEIGELKDKVLELKDKVSNAMDVKRQLLAHPFVGAALAAIAGFLVVPKKVKRSEHDVSIEQFIAELRKKFQVPAESDERHKANSWTKRGAGFLKGYAVQMLISLAKKRLATYLSELAARSSRNVNRSANYGNAGVGRQQSHPLHPQR